MIFLISSIARYYESALAIEIQAEKERIAQLEWEAQRFELAICQLSIGGGY